MARRKTAKPKERPKAKDLAGMTQKERLRMVVAGINAEAGRDVVRVASDASSSYLLRRPTGIISLDLGLAGGFPAAAPTVLTGPDGAGKDYLLWRTCAEAQRIYGDDFACAIYLTEFKADKLFMKDVCGFHVGMTPEEIEELDEARQKAGLPALTDEQREYYAFEIGSPYIIDGVIAEQGFDSILTFVESNTCQIAAVNSIGFLQTAAKEKKEKLEEFAQQANEAMLMTKFMPKLANILNAGGPDGERNETAIILVNQVRSKDEKPRGKPGVPIPERKKYRSAVQAWALKHGKAIELMLHKGKPIWDEEMGIYVGKESFWELTKGKLGTHEGIKGSYNFFFDGGADIVGGSRQRLPRQRPLHQARGLVRVPAPRLRIQEAGRGRCASTPDGESGDPGPSARRVPARRRSGLPAPLMARSTKSRKRDSRREEAKTAKKLGGRLTFNSGTDYEKGDGRVFGQFRIENKITDNESYRLEGEEFSFLWRQAMMAGEEPLFVIRVPVPGVSTLKTRLVAITQWYAESLGIDCTDVPVLNRGGEAGAKGYALSTKRWMKHGEAQGFLRLVLREHSGVRKNIVVMRWERFCELTGYNE